MASLALGVKFNATSAGTVDFVYSSAVSGYVGPAATSPAMVNGKTYRYRAENASLTEWEFGSGVYTSATQTIARTTIALSSSGAKVSFTAAPIVGVVPFPDDILQFDDAMSLTTAQKKQAQSNILVAPVVTTYLSGSGTHTITTGCTRIKVKLAGGGGGGQGGGSSTSGGAGGAGGNTTFGTALLVGNGGAGGVGPNTPSVGGAASLGGASGIAISGGGGNGGGQAAAGGGYYSGAPGGASIFGAAGAASGAATAGGAAPANSGGGGGGGNSSAGGASINFGVAGAGGGGLEAYINSPAATYSYAVGAGGTAGTAGTGGTAGGAGGSGAIIVEEYFGS